jgi:ubiquinone/menaquinone biosynthesis C-methylase UbiE
VADSEFRKDLSHLTWDEVLRRQVERGHLIPEWLDALDVQPGECVLDVGSGPGFVSQQVAMRVGPQGSVLALDCAPEALAYLERLRDDCGLTQILPLLGDAATVDLRDHQIDAALVTMMLHHAEDPAGLVRHVAALLKPGARAVLAEFDPNGPCTSGPPREHRVSPETARAWCEEAGLQSLSLRQQSSEHYMLVLQSAQALIGDAERHG